MSTLPIAAVQMCSNADRDHNLARARALMEKAVRRGARLIALPENFSFMGPDGAKRQVVEDPQSGPSVRFLSGFAAQHQVAIIGGSIPLPGADGARVTNTCLVFDPAGAVVARYDKLHLFDVSIDETDTHSESRYVQPGQQVVTVDVLGQRLGLSICYDLRFPELYRTLALQGAHILFVPAAFTVPTGKDHWEVLLRARAIENQCYVVAPAQFGRHGRRRMTYGRAMIVDPWGQIMAQCQDKEDAIVCEVDLAFQDDVRRRLPCLQHVHQELLPRCL